MAGVGDDFLREGKRCGQPDIFRMGISFRGKSEDSGAAGDPGQIPGNGNGGGSGAAAIAADKRGIRETDAAYSNCGR